MGDVVHSVSRVSAIIGEITAASQNQSERIEQIYTAIGQVDSATQQNAALVEEASAATAMLQDQAAGLAQMVSIFKIGAGMDKPVLAVVPDGRKEQPRMARSVRGNQGAGRKLLANARY
jgi:methyl-accepting chemotaxis protein